jgi:DNA-directed RNA polymerase subunit RPC12/RpoP
MNEENYWTEKEIEQKAWRVKTGQSPPPMKKVRPIGLAYECAECGKTFVEAQEIHIPLCRSCRADRLEELSQAARTGWMI